MKRLSPTQQRVLADLTSGTGYHLRWEENKWHLRVYSQGGLRQAGDPVRPQTLDSLARRGLLDLDRLPGGTPTFHPTVDAWALAERGFRS